MRVHPMSTAKLSSGAERRVRQATLVNGRLLIPGAAPLSNMPEERRSGCDRRVASYRGWITESMDELPAGGPTLALLTDLVLALRREAGAAEAVAWCEASLATQRELIDSYGVHHDEHIEREVAARAAYLKAKGR